MKPIRVFVAAAIMLSTSTASFAGTATPTESISPDEIYCLALNLYHEGRGEGLDGAIAVGNVTLNRVDSGRYPDTICEVVKQGGERLHRCQFSWWCDGRSDTPKDKQAWALMVQLSLELIEGEWGDNTNGALFYHTKAVNPYWNKDMLVSAIIGRHIFY